MEDKKEEKKKAKKPEKKDKKPEIDLFNTPVYELTEDQIIQKGLKTHNPKDVMCYIGIVVCFIFIFIPPIFNKVFDYTRPADTHVDVTYAKISCHKSASSDGAETYIKSEYKDSVVQTMNIEFIYDETETGATSDVTSWFAFEKTKGFKINKQKNNGKNTVSVDIDFKNNEELRENEELSEYTMNFVPQLQHFSSKSFFCSKETVTVNEDTAHPENNKENVWDQNETTK